MEATAIRPFFYITAVMLLLVAPMSTRALEQRCNDNVLFVILLGGMHKLKLQCLIIAMEGIRIGDYLVSKSFTVLLKLPVKHPA